MGGAGSELTLLQHNPAGDLVINGAITQPAGNGSSLTKAGFEVTPVMDRSYFHSIYFRERGGVLFEIATETPGFLIDESVDILGEALKLPEWLEPNRSEIEQNITPLVLKTIEEVN